MVEQTKPKTWSAAQVQELHNFLSIIEILAQAVSRMTILWKDD